MSIILSIIDPTHRYRECNALTSCSLTFQHQWLRSIIATSGPCAWADFFMSESTRSFKEKRDMQKLKNYNALCKWSITSWPLTSFCQAKLNHHLKGRVLDFEFKSLSPWRTWPCAPPKHKQMQPSCLCLNKKEKIQKIGSEKKINTGIHLLTSGFRPGREDISQSGYILIIIAKWSNILYNIRYIITQI